MLYIVGLGLGDERDITVRGLDAVRSCAKVYMEAYTSLLSLGLDPSSLTKLVRLPSPPATCLRWSLVLLRRRSFVPATCSRKWLARSRRSRPVVLQEKLYGKEITTADREMVEERADQMLHEAADTDVAFLVVGDPFG
jgi:diphthine methyl ester synthase